MCVTAPQRVPASSPPNLPENIELRVCTETFQQIHKALARFTPSLKGRGGSRVSNSSPSAASLAEPMDALRRPSLAPKAAPGRSWDSAPPDPGICHSPPRTCHSPRDMPQPPGTAAASPPLPPTLGQCQSEPAAPWKNHAVVASGLAWLPGSLLLQAGRPINMMEMTSNCSCWII